jgi:hypothetical protein
MELKESRHVTAEVFLEEGGGGRGWRRYLEVVLGGGGE